MLTTQLSSKVKLNPHVLRDLALEPYFGTPAGEWCASYGVKHDEHGSIASYSQTVQELQNISLDSEILLSQSDSTRNPTLNIRRGRPVLTFGGSQFLSYTGANVSDRIEGVEHENPYTVAMVVEIIPNSTQSRQTLFSIESSSTPATRRFGWDNQNSKFYTSINNDVGSGQIYPTIEQDYIIPGTMLAIVYVFDGVTSSIYKLDNRSGLSYILHKDLRYNSSMAFDTISFGAANVSTPIDFGQHHLYHAAFWDSAVRNPKQLIRSLASAYDFGRDTDSIYARNLDTSTLMRGVTSHVRLSEFNGSRHEYFNNFILTQVNGTIPSISGKFGTSAAVNFTSADSQHLTTATNQFVDMGSVETGAIDFWIYPDDVSTLQYLISKWAGSTAAERDFRVGITSSGEAQYDRHGGGADGNFGTATSTNTFTISDWNHVYIQWTSSEIQIVLNGDTVNKGIATFSGGNSIAGDLTVGALGDASNYFDGRMNSITFRNRLLTDQEIAELYNMGTGEIFPYN